MKWFNLQLKAKENQNRASIHQVGEVKKGAQTVKTTQTNKPDPKSNRDETLKNQLTEREERIETLQEQLGNQKQKAHDQARLFAQRSLKREVILARIEERMYDKIYSKLSEDIGQKLTTMSIEKKTTEPYSTCSRKGTVNLKTQRPLEATCSNVQLNEH
ncbi:hypothetical protein HHI36_002300 [Cryptolaemus montrouzieri]|uniref:Uncharacterized protein n=1 Tax=Cryptolaemus montrouzieri TaxID=559131 RepID=A0ABD2PA16_9CUCU